MLTELSSKFLEQVLKSVQSSCLAHTEFSYNVQIIGHLYICVDDTAKDNIIINETVLKDDEASSITFKSDSFTAIPQSKVVNKSGSKSSERRTCSSDESILSAHKEGHTQNRVAPLHTPPALQHKNTSDRNVSPTGSGPKASHRVTIFDTSSLTPSTSYLDDHSDGTPGEQSEVSDASCEPPQKKIRHLKSTETYHCDSSSQSVVHKPPHTRNEPDQAVTQDIDTRSVNEGIVEIETIKEEPLDYDHPSMSQVTSELSAENIDCRVDRNQEQPIGPVPISLTSVHSAASQPTSIKDLSSSQTSRFALTATDSQHDDYQALAENMSCSDTDNDEQTLKGSRLCATSASNNVLLGQKEKTKVLVTDSGSMQAEAKLQVPTSSQPKFPTSSEPQSSTAETKFSSTPPGWPVKNGSFSQLSEMINASAFETLYSDTNNMNSRHQSCEMFRAELCHLRAELEKLKKKKKVHSVKEAGVPTLYNGLTKAQVEEIINNSSGLGDAVKHLLPALFTQEELDTSSLMGQKSNYKYPSKNKLNPVRRNLMEVGVPLGNSRYGEDSDDDALSAQQQNQSTKRKTGYDINLFQCFLTEKGERRIVEDIPPDELCPLLSRFFLSVKKKDGTEYEPVSLRAFLSSIDRHLRQKKYPASIVNDYQFKACRDTLKYKQKQLKAIGKGSKIKPPDPLSSDVIDRFYKARVLGPFTPKSLLNSMWVMCTVNFGLRTGVETHSLKWGDIEVRVDDNGHEYVVCTQERQSKTKTGENSRDSRKVISRAYAISDATRDPVRLFRQFSTKRPKKMKSPDSPFFLAINHQGWLKGKPWYKTNALGLNSVYAMMKTMLQDANMESDESDSTYIVQSRTEVPQYQIIHISSAQDSRSLLQHSRVDTEQNRHISSLSFENKPETIASTSTSRSLLKEENSEPFQTLSVTSTSCESKVDSEDIKKKHQHTTLYTASSREQMKGSITPTSTQIEPQESGSDLMKVKDRNEDYRLCNTDRNKTRPSQTNIASSDHDKVRAVPPVRDPVDDSVCFEMGEKSPSTTSGSMMNCSESLVTTAKPKNVTERYVQNTETTETSNETGNATGSSVVSREKRHTTTEFDSYRRSMSSVGNTGSADDSLPQSLATSVLEMTSSENENEELKLSSKQDGIKVFSVDDKGSCRFGKRCYCYFCKKPLTKISRHLKNKHRNEAQVQEYISEKDPAKKGLLFLKLRNLGNHEHNLEVLKNNQGELIVSRRPSVTADYRDYKTCEFCYAYLNRTCYLRHHCPLAPRSKELTKNAGQSVNGHNECLDMNIYERNKPVKGKAIERHNKSNVNSTTVSPGYSSRVSKRNVSRRVCPCHHENENTSDSEFLTATKKKEFSSKRKRDTSVSGDFQRVDEFEVQTLKEEEEHYIAMGTSS